ncbi:MAG TPA: hypothetical protein VH854_08305 [Thermoanaerobaculia bacterium]|jgi:hypothetical protein|nr:hypothetical protein [Thermoanaerobaculia bacterium]
MHRRLVSIVIVLNLGSLPLLALGDTVPVLFPEGVVHGYLTLSTLEGKRIADGDSTQVAKGDRVTNKTSFRFADGSTHEETTIFTQRGHFQLVSYRLVQKGPAFPQPMDVSVDRASGRCVVRTTDKDGKEKTYDEQLELPLDLANGLVPTLLKNVRGDLASIELPMVLATPKPRLVKLLIGPAGEESFRNGAAAHKATRYRVHVDLGGVVGVVAEVAGKQPPDTFVWIERGEAPAFVKSEGPMAADVPPWRIELAAPAFGAK